jgi:S1 RNA binding domain protein
MQLEVGKIYDGKVNGITKFGAFVDLDAETKGMVHISEVASSYVEDIKDHLKEGQSVRVKVLSLGDDGKVALSIKKAAPVAAQQSRPPQPGRGGGNQPGRGGGSRNNNNRRQARDSAPATPEEAAFEDMMNKFKQSSDERMHDLKRTIDNNRKSPSRRK